MKRYEVPPATPTHGAELAAYATSWIPLWSWETAIRSHAVAGHTFAADDVQAAYGLPDLGNAVGGIFMQLHRAREIVRVGYRPSKRASRAGSVVAIWSAGPRLLRSGKDKAARKAAS